MFRMLHFAGKEAEFDKAKEVIKNLYSTDSLVSEYVDYLITMADDAASGNDLKASNSYLRRAIIVSDSIRQQETLRKLSEQMSLNMVQKYQLERQDAEIQVAHYKETNILLSIILFIILTAGAIITLLYRRNKRNEEILEIAQQDLNNQEEELQNLVQQLDEAKAERIANNNNMLYERIEQVVDEESLYLNPDLDIKMLAQAVNSSRSQVSACINSHTGKPFRQWISEYRISLFVKMLKENPDTSIDILVMRCGYKEQSTFRRQFKAAYGMTAGEYRKQLTINDIKQTTLPIAEQ